MPRQIATAQNIANANSESYRPLRVTFEGSLRAAAARGSEAIAQVQPQIGFEPVSQGGSDIRLDLELATASQTAMRYGALIGVLEREGQLERTVISGAGR